MKPTEEDQALKMISDSLSWESLDAVPPSEIKQLQGRIVSAIAAEREKRPTTWDEFVKAFTEKYDLPLYDTKSCKFYVQRAIRFQQTGSVD